MFGNFWRFSNFLQKFSKSKTAKAKANKKLVADRDSGNTKAQTDVEAFTGIKKRTHLKIAGLYDKEVNQHKLS